MSSPFAVNKTELMEQTLDRLDIQHRRTKRGWQKVRCPSSFHVNGDRNPSASVNLSIGKFHCHGCGLHGDGFDLLLAIEGMKAVGLDWDLTPSLESGRVPEWIL